MKMLIYTCVILIVSVFAFTQNAVAQTNTFPSTGNAGIGTTTPTASALLDMESTTKGILIPHMTLVQRNAIVSPATGLMIYQTNGAKGFFYYNGTAWTAVSGGWKLTGNAGTNPATNFIGTTDNESVVFKAGDVPSGLLDVTNFNTMFGIYSGNRNTGSQNSFFGYSAGTNNTSGSQNTAIGFNSFGGGTGTGNAAFGYASQYFATTASYNASFGWGALYRDSTGSSNTAFGTSALQNNTTAYSNVAVGTNALYSNTNVSNLVAIGDSALYNNTAGVQNTAVGNKALFSNTISYDNNAVGNAALFSNTVGTDNSADGDLALFANTAGSNNTADGSQALYGNINGSDNTAIGYQALNYSDSGSQNIAVGGSALYQNSGGNGNVSIGYGSLFSNKIGYGNTAAGEEAMDANTTGNQNTSFGEFALSTNTTGFDNTAVGAEADESFGTGTFENSSVFGANGLITASNQVRIGDNIVTSIGGYKAWTNISDGRVKTNIKQNVPGLAFINLLQPITYNLDLDAADKIIQPPVHKGKDGKPMQPSPEALTARKAQEQVVCTGFIAQNVEASAKSIGYDFDGVDAAKNSKDLYGLRYSEFVVPLVKAVQELSVQNDSLKQNNTSLQLQINELKAMVEALAEKSGVSLNSQSATISSASLEQNIPNPFSSGTTIGYILPQTFATAQILITDNSGKTLKMVQLSASGKGTVNVDTSTLPAGAYNYSLLVDGKLISTKQMVLAR